MKLKVYFVNAFTDVLFKGNSAAVVVANEWLDDELMQFIASENNLSETAFCVKDDDNCYKIRWFSPITEIDFCGHATLASAFILFNQYNCLAPLTFTAEAVGDLTVTKGAEDLIEMSFPNRMPTAVHEIPQDLMDGLSIKPQEVYRNQQAYFVIYTTDEEVRAVEQNPDCLKRLAPLDVVVTSASTHTSKNYDFISRYFWPANGGDEDPVTGSIHAGLAPFWSKKLGKDRLSAFQASQRGGYLSCHVKDDRVFISGHAVQYLEGTIAL